MLRAIGMTILAIATVVLSGSAFAQQPQFGSATDAKAMLERAIVAVKADRGAALAKFNKGEGRLQGPRPVRLLRRPEGRDAFAW